MGVHTDERVLTVIEIVGTLAQVEIDDADGVDLLHLIVFLAQFDVLCDGFGHAIEDALQVIKLTRLLNFNEDDLAFGIQRLDVHTVKFVVLVTLIAFAFQNLYDGHFLVQKHGHQSFEHTEVGLVAQHALGCPVETYVLIHSFLYFFSQGKDKTKIPNCKAIRNFIWIYVMLVFIQDCPASRLDGFA